MFFANGMFESVGQITDMCTIYSFIESKLHVKQNIESLQHGINDLDALREEIQRQQQEEKDAHTNKLLTVIGVLAIISIAFDGVQFISWLAGALQSLAATSPWILITAPIVLALVAVSWLFLRKRSKNKK
jgi:hypothetical protein